MLIEGTKMSGVPIEEVARTWKEYKFPSGFGEFVKFHQDRRDTMRSFVGTLVKLGVVKSNEFDETSFFSYSLACKGIPWR